MGSYEKVPKEVAELARKVACGEMSMQAANLELREWYKSLTPEKRQFVSENRASMARTLTSAADGIGSELFVTALNP